MARVVAGLVMVLFAWAGVAEAAPRRANLTVKSLSEAGALAPSAPVKLTATVRNGGRAKARRSRVALLLSRDGKRSRDDLKLVVVNVKALARRKSARVTLRSRLPAAAKAGMRFLACADDARKVRESSEQDNCRAARQPLRFLDGPMGGGLPAPVAPVTPAPAPQPTATPTPPAPPGPPNLTVTPQLDADHAVIQEVSIFGGTLEATGADGTGYTLEIPADALLAPATVTMTPLQGVGGAAMSGPVYGVDLQPHGLRLAQPAKLTITPATHIPLSDQMGFGYVGDGDLFHYAPLTPDTTEVALQVNHFSGHGAGGTTPADRAAQAGAEYPSEGEQQALNELGPAMQEWKETGVFPKEKFEAGFRRWYENSVKPNLLAAQTLEDKVYPALKEWLSWGRQMAVLDFASILSPDLELPLGREASASNGSARKVLFNAYKRARDACLVDHDVQAAPRLLRYAKDISVLFNEEAGAIADLQACLSFELDVRVQFTEYGDLWANTVSVEVLDVPMRLSDSLFSVVAEKPVTFPTWTKLGYENEDGDWCDYTLEKIVQGTPFQFRELNLDLNYSDDSPTPRSERIRVHFRPGTATAQFTDSCTGLLTEDDNVWPTTWVRYHPEGNPTITGELSLAGFSYVGNSILGRRTYDITQDPVEGGQAGYSETSTIEIRHTPG